MSRNFGLRRALHPALAILTLLLTTFLTTLVAPAHASGTVPTPKPFNHTKQVSAKSGGMLAGYTPQQLAAAYGIKPARSARPIVITVAYHHAGLVNDVNQTRAAAGLPPVKLCATATGTGCLDVRDKDGGTNFTPNSNWSWGLEEVLDVVVATSLSPNSRVIVVEADEPMYFGSTGLGQALATGRALAGPGAVYNLSWGSGEFDSQTLFAEMYLSDPAATYLVASGDAGFGTGFPASAGRALSIGGTTLTLKGTRRVNETLWAGSGGGCSVITPKPADQTVPDCGSYKAANDVSAVGDPSTGIGVIFNGATYLVGGTSLSAPVIAAQAANAKGSVGRPNSPDRYLIDVTAGANCSTAPECQATPGYDLPSGWGVPTSPQALVN